MSNFDHDRELPERFDEFTGPFSSSGTGHDAHTTGARTPRSFDAAAFASEFSPNFVRNLREALPLWETQLYDLMQCAYVEGRADARKESRP